MAVNIEDRIKAWLTPGLITCFGVASWNIISEIRSDVKALLEANAATQVKIQNLEKRLDNMEDVIYTDRLAAILPKEQPDGKRKKGLEN